MKISSQELALERVNEDIHMNILLPNYTSSLGHLMVSLKWGKVTVIVVLPQD